MFFQRRSPALLLVYAVCTAVLTLALALTYIPKARQTHEIERFTLRELVPSTRHCYLYMGDSAELSVSPVPDTAPAELDWHSSDPSIASLEGGTVTGGKPGEAVLTVNSSAGISVNIPVTVIRKPVPPDSDLPALYYDRPIIANVDNNLGEDYIPELVYVPEKYPSPRRTQVTPEMCDVYERLYADCEKATGSGFVLLSGYRSYKKQVQLFEEDVASFRAKGYSLEESRQRAGLTTQIPGCSEHQLGLSVDISTNYALSNHFGETKVGKWVTENAWKYGLILRYPEGKYDKTGIEHEAWHFRLVGVEHAKYIYDHGICLEEYLERQSAAAAAADKYAQTHSAEEYYNSEFGMRNSELS